MGQTLALRIRLILDKAGRAESDLQGSRFSFVKVDRPKAAISRIIRAVLRLDFMTT